MNATDANFHNIVSSKEAIHLIETSAQTLMENPDMANALPAIILRGGAGVGKSTIVRDVAKKLGIGFVDVRLAQMERVDLCGLPSVSNNMTQWNVPSIWPQDQNSAGIIFFDEITSAPSDTQVAAYSLILDRAIPNTDYRLPPRWLIVAAGNRTIDRAVVKSMSSALANRFAHFELEANAEEWVEWAQQHSIRPSVTGFIQFKPANLFRMDNQNLEAGWPTPRSWEKVSNMLDLFGTNEEILRKVVYGLVGPSVGVEFIEFHKIQKKFTNVLDVLTNPKAPVEIPTKSDEKFAYCSAVSYLLWNGKDEADTKNRVDGFFRIVKGLTPDFASLLIHLASLGNAKVNRLQAILHIKKNPAYEEFMKEHGNSFNKKYAI